ncbi:ABC transporter ATP-binding protein [Dactylosporangium matsuzakiense]|uniref:Multidrug ABC transporter ATP-binding protein n=1 Tax=Dactylosporangium matsuzakiense TaxID=53360 RepID=A0A9W6KF84_9ACTN|nr:ATP-binding cassette domain-containing protein [Dactylosporangium matsuzakiense]UWZ41121.1 ATP-binding cassette domain-containing protein [Dactylosporangium matsuzakiense]GLL00977.1 multidrug ABC transporter ATP-binding protein [Dactylosporangium matsuzakiense]
MSDATIEVAGLRKRYGSTAALDGMSFTAKPGRVTGFVGPNGAGKSTTMRIILGLHTADSGRALVGGRPYRSLRSPLRYLGALLDASALHPARTGRNHLLWLARSQGLGRARVDEVVELVGLASAGRRPAGGYSLGMQQRLGLAAALLADPPAIMLDEPFNGMDPEGIVWLRRFLRTLAGQGRAVLVSSHLMGELQGMADHVVVAGRGRVIADSSVADLIAAASGDRVRVRTSAAGAVAAALTAAGADVAGTAAGVLSVRGLGAERVVAVLTARGLPFSELAPHRATLEEAYFDLTSDAVEYRAAATGASS